MHYIQPFDTDLQTTLDALRRRVFDENDYFWFDSVPRPATLAELDAMFTDEPDFESPEFDILVDVVTSGTHSILDARTAGPRGDIQPLNEMEAVALFGIARPCGKDFERVDLGQHTPDRWNGGSCIALYDPQGSVTSIGFWGATGD